MRLAVIKSRMALVGERGAIDVAAVSAGKFPPSPRAIYERWAQFSAWYAANSEAVLAAEATSYRADELGAPVPEPRQVFAIGMNYRAHAAEAGLARPSPTRSLFAKFPSCGNRSRGGCAAAFRGGRLRGRAGGGDRRARPPRRAPGRVGARGRPDPRPGPVRATRAVPRAGPAVLAGQVLPRLLPHRAGYWLPPTSSPIPTTSRSVAASTGSRCKRGGPTTLSSAFRT